MDFTFGFANRYYRFSCQKEIERFEKKKDYLEALPLSDLFTLWNSYETEANLLTQAVNMLDALGLILSGAIGFGNAVPTQDLLDPRFIFITFLPFILTILYSILASKTIWYKQHIATQMMEIYNRRSGLQEKYAQ